MSLNSVLESSISDNNDSRENTNAIKIKIFDPIPNKNWLETKVNTWFKENKVEILSINMNFTDDKYLLTLIYREIN